MNEVLQFWGLEALLSKYTNADKAVKDFTLKILKNIGFGPQLGKASEFLFGDSDELPRKLRKGVEMRFHSFPSMIYQINTFKLGDFNTLYDCKLSHFEFELIKGKVREVIQSYFNTKVKGSYVRSSYLRKDVGKVLLSAIYAASLHDNLQRQSGTQFYGMRGKSTDTLGISLKALQVIAREGPSTKENLEKMYKTIVGWHQQEYGDRSKGIEYQGSVEQREKLFAYQEALNNIYKFARRNGFSFDSVTVKDMKLLEALDSKKELVMNEYDTIYWTSDVSKAYINVFQIAKYLGIDPLVFRINPSNALFDPHHFKAFPFRKMSTHTQDIIVTSKLFHAKYEAIKNEYGWRAAEAYVESLIKSLEELLLLKDDAGNFRKIEDIDVQRVLQKYFGAEWNAVYKGWVSEFTKGMDGIDNYEDALDKINERRLKYLPGNPDGNTYEDFLDEQYNAIYEKYKDHLKYLINKYISKSVAIQEDIDYFNILFPGTQLKLKI